MFPLKRRVPVLAVIFLAAFLIRAYQPVSRPLVWLERADQFVAAMSKAEWANTYASNHPGFTTMVIGGTGLYLHDRVEGTPLEAIFAWAVPSFATEMGQEVAAGVMALSVAIAALIVLAMLAVDRLSGRWELAVAAGGFLTFSPFFLTQSRVFHVDALMSILMLLSALLAFIALEEEKRVFLVLSGVAGGFAILSKVPAIFLIPFVGLALLAYVVRDLWRQRRDLIAADVLQAVGSRIALPLGIWLLCAAVPFLLWPAMWVTPVEVISQIIGGTVEIAEVPHANPEFFAGQLYADEVFGPLFYPTVLLFHSSYLMVLFLAIGVGHYALWRHRVEQPLPGHIYALMAAYVVFFVIQMSLGSKQIFRYVLPSALMLELMAAVGLVGVLRLLGERAVRLTLAGAIVLQALVVLPYLPDYGAHRNQLLGANRGAQNVISLTGQNEGIIIAAGYLAGREGTVATLNPTHNSLEQYYPGAIMLEAFAQADYVLFSHASIQRRFDAVFWEDAWDLAQAESPALVIRYDGVPYLSLYDVERPDAETLTYSGGGMLFVGLAWVVTLGTIAGLVVLLRRQL